MVFKCKEKVGSRSNCLDYRHVIPQIEIRLTK